MILFIFGSNPPVEKGFIQNGRVYVLGFSTEHFPSNLGDWSVAKIKQYEQLDWHRLCGTSLDTWDRRFGVQRFVCCGNGANLLLNIGMFIDAHNFLTFKLIESVTWVNWTPPLDARQCLCGEQKKTFAKTSKVQRWAFQVTSSDGVPPRIPGFLRGEIPNP